MIALFSEAARVGRGTRDLRGQDGAASTSCASAYVTEIVVAGQQAPGDAGSSRVQARMSQKLLLPSDFSKLHQQFL
jgi:hypothetical protein